MGENVFKSICWDITPRCNEHCGFCYRNSNNKELDLEYNKIILKKILDFGVDKISFVGGEPLLYNGLFELLEWGRSYSKGKTMFSITTNAIMLSDFKDNVITINAEMMDLILKMFDWVTFSLDAPNKEIQSLMGRNPIHYNRIITLLEYFRNNNIQNKVKINTVVSNINFNYIIDLYKILCEYPVKRWKLFRFLPSRGSALEYKDKYYISKEAFMNKMQEVTKYNIQNKIKISVNGYDNFNNSYITISPDGKLIVYDNGKYKNKVDLLCEDISQILQYINLAEHRKNRSDFLYI